MLKRERVVVTDLLATLRTIGRNAISAAGAHLFTIFG